MQKETRVAKVETVPTRSGNTRYVVRDEDGDEYTTFRPGIGEEAGRYEGQRAVIEFHEEERNGFRNVYLDSISPAGDEGAGQGEASEVDEVAWKTAVEAAPWLAGSESYERELDSDELFDKLKPFKDKVAEDIEDGED